MLRGARQVGKSYLIREFGQSFDHFAEINFEFSPRLISVFEKDLDPVRIVRDLSLFLGEQIVPEKTLLFLDEIQECPKAITALRYFYEKLPELHVVSAGSLVDFALEEIGIPVGRIDFLHLYPLSFLEFLTAKGYDQLRVEIENPPDLAKELPALAHKKLLDLLGEYLAVGGMPEAVEAWVESEDLKQCTAVHKSLVQAFRQDFVKYAGRVQQNHVEMVFSAIPRLLGRKFVFHSVTPDVRSRTLRPALELLAKAQVAHIVNHSASNGVPLGAEVNPRLFKVLLLDVALTQTLLGIDLGKWILDASSAIANRGEIIEAFVGQEMLAYGAPDIKGELFYWVREKRSSSAEIDYVAAQGPDIIPIEVKAGVSGSTKSLHQFLKTKTATRQGIVFSAQPFDPCGPVLHYPLYAVSRLTSNEA